MRLPVFLVFFLLLCVGCGGRESEGPGAGPPPVPGMSADRPADRPADKPADKPADSPRVPPAPTDPKPAAAPLDWQAAASLLAGLGDGLPPDFTKIAALPAFRAYAERIGKMWKPVEQKRSVVEKWVKSELAALNAGCRTLFYPFSGPDFLHVHLLFPGCRNVVMIGLEPAGTPPELPRILERPEKFFSKLEESLVHILTLSFFRTKSMQEDLFGKEVPELDGTLAPILFMMARTGHRVSAVERVQLDWDGKVVPWTGTLPDPPAPPEPVKKRRRPPKPVKRTWKPYSGLRYTYSAPGDATPRTLTYFSCNLANEVYREVDGVLGRPDLQKYLRGLDISTTYTKAASYLMHHEWFSWIRDFILDRSPTCLQDDSGIPISAFDQNKWDILYYGFYDVPIELFMKQKQEELARRYAGGRRVRPLPFGIGYKVYPGRSNLQLAIRKK